MTYLDRERYSPCLVTRPGDLEDHARRHEIPVYFNDFPWFSRRRPWLYANSIRQLMRVMRRENVKLVHTNCPHALPYVMLACRLLRTPYVSHIHDFRYAWFEASRLRALNRAEAVIPVSRAVAGTFAEAGVSESRMRVIYNPFDLGLYERAPQESGRDPRTSIGLPEDSFAVGIVGQILDMKGHEDLVLASPDVVSKVPDAHFVVVGEAFTPETKAFKSKLDRLIGQFGLTDRFHFTGFRSDVPEVMKWLDVLVVPSWREPFGRVVVEGMAAGCPVIGTRAGGIPEIIEHMKDGLLVPPKDVRMLGETIVQVARDAQLRERLRRAGPESAKRFSTEQHVDHIQALYDSVLGSPSTLLHRAG